VLSLIFFMLPSTPKGKGAFVDIIAETLIAWFCMWLFFGGERKNA